MAFDRKKYLKEWHLKNRERRLRERAERYQRNRDTLLKFYQENKDRLNAIRRAYRALHRDEINARLRPSGVPARKPRMTKEQVGEICRRYETGETAQKIAPDFGLNFTAVLYFVRKHGITVRPAARYRFLNTTQEDKIVAEYLAGKSVVTLAREWGFSDCVVYDALVRRKVNRSQKDPAYVHDIHESAFSNAQQNPTAAYWVGFLMTDGCICASRDRPNTFHISVALAARDASHLEKFLSYMGSSDVVRFKQPTISSGKGITVRSTGTAYVRIRCPHRLRDDLFGHGVVPRKTPIAEVRGLEFNPHFWRGVIDGDGTITRTIQCGSHYPKVKLCGASRRLMEQFRDFIKHIADKTPQIQSRREDGFRTFYGIETAGVSAMKLIREMYHNAPVSLDRKQNRADYLMELQKLNPHWLHNKTCGVIPNIMPLRTDPFAIRR